MPPLPILTPPALRRGDTIALVSPSARVQNVFPLRMSRATAFLESEGFKVRSIHSDPLPARASDAVKARAAELHAAFSDPAVRAIVCCIGGFTVNEIVPHLDYKLIRANPKILVGSSDITVLHHALYAGAGLRSFYGPSAITAFGEYPAPLSLTWNHFRWVVAQDATESEPRPHVGPVPRSKVWTDEFLDWTGEPGNLRARHTQPSPGWKWLRPGRAVGVMWGGCLPSVLQPFSTPWAVDYNGVLLLLELPEGEAPGAPWPMELVQQNLGDLGMRGVWGKIKGLVLGRPYRHTPEQAEQWERLVMDSTAGYSFPILAGVDVGHTDPMVTVPLGARAMIDSERDIWEFLEPAVERRVD